MILSWRWLREEKPIIYFLRTEWFLVLNKLESPSPNYDLCQVWLKLVQWFWRRRFLNFVSVFSLFPWKGQNSPFEQAQIPFNQGCFGLSLVEIGPVVLEIEEDFWISSMFFRYFLIISPWKYWEALNLNKLESLSPNDALCQVGWNWLSGSGEDF